VGHEAAPPPAEREHPGGEVAERRRNTHQGLRALRCRHVDGVGDQDERTHHDQRRRQAPDPTTEETPEGDRTGGLPLEQEQRRDQVAGQDEEHVDAHVPAFEDGVAEVVHHDGQDREAPDPVERGSVLQPPHLR